MMTLTAPVRPAVWAGRTGAALAVTSASLHVAALAGHGSIHITLILIMAASCLYCARHLWSEPRHHDWALVAIMNIGMIAMHLGMSMPSPHAHHTMAPQPTRTSNEVPISTAALLLAGIEAVFATIVLFVTTRSVPDEVLNRRRA